MNKYIIPLATFLLGSGAGFMVAKSLLEQKYATIAEAEIASVKETFDKRREELEMALEDLKKATVKAKNVKPALEEVAKQVDDTAKAEKPSKKTTPQA